MIKKYIFRIALVLSTLVILIPIVVFVFHFNSQIISNSISDWGSFGDYIGGLINTVVSILSLIILAYITYLIGENSNKENKRLFILQKRIVAYEELAKYFPRINLSATYLMRDMRKYYLSQVDISETKFKPDSDDFFEYLKEVMEYHYFLFNFKLRYSHLFDYNFESKKYKELMESSKKLNDSFVIFNNYLVNPIKEEKIDIKQIFDIHIDKVVVFVNEIRKELK